MVRVLLVLILLIAVAVLIGFVVGYNKIRAADVRVEEALGGIDVELTRRAALIPALIAAVSTFAAHEQAVLSRITAAQTALNSATGSTSVQARSAAERQLDTAVGQVLALGAAHPQLSLSQNFLHLQQNLSDTEDKLAFARQYYNDTVATLNRLVSSIPWMYVAPIAGIGEREYYQTPR